jgi:tetratricopeptide (TPR) repeat protein
VIPLLPRATALLLLLARPAPASDGWEYLAKGKPSFARTAFTNQLKRSPDDARAHVGLGLSELALGNSDKACEILLDSIKRSPEDRDAHLGLARSLLLRARRRIAAGRGEEEETRYFLLDAQNQAERAADLKRDDPEAWVVVTEARLELGKFEEAERSISEASAGSTRRSRGGCAASCPTSWSPARPRRGPRRATARRRRRSRR